MENRIDFSPENFGRGTGMLPEESSGRQASGGQQPQASEGSNPRLAHETPAVIGKAESRKQKAEMGGEMDWKEAEARARVCEEFERLRGEGWSGAQAARALGRAASWFSGESSALGRWRRGGVAALLPDRRAQGATVGELTAQIEALGWFVPAARHFYLLTNRTRESGSVPEAIRRAISLPNLPVGWKEADRERFLRAIGAAETPNSKLQIPIKLQIPSCPVELREKILARERAGQPMVPGRIARQVTSSPARVRQYRNPTEAGLDYLCAPGGLRLTEGNEENEGRRLARAGEIIEADDATINFPVCVPWKFGGDKCSEKFGVRVGRFQWLVSIDAGTSFVTGFSYTARPKSSYRAEDILSLMRIVCLEHGVPKRWRLERGSWESKLVKGAIANMGSQLETVYSPHQKPFIEGLFNTLWTKLSVHFPGSQVGRFRGEHEATAVALTACQQGQKDPRRYFPMLSDVIAAFCEVIAEKNRTPVNSVHHGRWVPEERWQGELASNPLPKFSDASDWIFSPWVREWKVRGMLIGGRVPIFEDFSVPFDFAADWLANWDGVRLKAHFDPAMPRCEAVLTLAEPRSGHRVGEVLGRATLVNEVAGYARMVMGWGSDNAGAGRVAKQQAASALRREVRAIVPKLSSPTEANKGNEGRMESEERDGISRVGKVSISATSNEEEKMDKPEREAALVEREDAVKRQFKALDFV